MGLLDAIVVGALSVTAVVEGLLLMSLPFLWPAARDFLRGFPASELGSDPHLKLRVAVALLASAVAYKLMLEAWCGGTIGRVLARQVVLDERGGTLGLHRALLRWLRWPETHECLRYRVPSDRVRLGRIVALTFVLLQLTAIAFVAAVGGF